MGDWTRSAKAGNSGRVLLSLTQSRNPIVSVSVIVDGLEQSALTGSDLRSTAGMYFTVPQAIGAHQVSVDASDAGGCHDPATRPMTLVVVE